MKDIAEEIKNKANSESKRIFENIRKARALTILGGKEIMAVSEESLTMLLKNAMIDGAKVLSDIMKQTVK